jgi:hypothetical protein
MLLKFASAGLFVSAALVSSVPASADQNASAQPRAQRATDPQKKICREDNIQTGSIMPKRTCKTQAEWDALAAKSQSNVDDLRDQNHSRDMVGGNR